MGGRIVHPSAWKENSANFALKLSEKSCRHPKLSCTEPRHRTVRPILAPIYRPIPRSERRSNPFSDSFYTEFYEVHSESALAAKTAIGIGASLVAAFLPDLRLRALRVEAQVGRRWLITPQAVGDFDEILVGVPQVHGQQRSGRPRASHGSFEDLNAVCP